MKQLWMLEEGDREDALDAEESGGGEDLIMETQMKLCLWSSLLSSVKEVVDEK